MQRNQLCVALCCCGLSLGDRDPSCLVEMDGIMCSSDYRPHGHS
jgi:hypothetical protein